MAWTGVIEPEMLRGVVTDRREAVPTTLGDALALYMLEAPRFNLKKAVGHG